MIGRVLAATAVLLALAPPAAATPIVTMPSQAAILYGDNPNVPTGLPAPAVYGWAWSRPVQVLDLTPAGSNWRIAEAVSEYAKGGLDISMTTDPAQAEVTVTEAYDECGAPSGSIVLGCAHMSGGQGGDTIHLNPGFATRPLAEHVGGHEVGHTIGLAHYLGGGRSWMKPSVSDSTYMTRPGPIDMRDVRTLYGRTA